MLLVYRKGSRSMPSRTRLQVSTSSIYILPPEVSRLSPKAPQTEEQPSNTFFMPGGRGADIHFMIKIYLDKRSWDRRA